MRTSILATVLVLALFLGCIGQTNPATSSTNAQPTGQVQTNTTATPVMPSSGSPTDQLNSILGNTEQRNYKVTYSVINGNFKETDIQYMKNNNVRVDTETDAKMTEVFMLNNNLYSCYKYKTINPLQGFTCVQLPQNSQVSIYTASTVKSSLAEKDVQTLPSQTIAGMEAQCFRLNPKGTASSKWNSMDYCFSGDGILLSMSGATTYNMTAIEIERNVADDIFVLPATPQ